MGMDSVSLIEFVQNPEPCPHVSDSLLIDTNCHIPPSNKQK